jgi:phosphonopyruvate decarboxylase
MVNAEDFLSEFLKLGLNYFTGVPDSTLKEWMTLLDDNQSIFENRIAANEGSAIAHAAGYYLATKKVSVVYLQNSGLGNCISPLTSLTDPEVYSIPLIMVMGWRGRPGFKDEPQHKKMGVITTEILDTLDISYSVLNSGNYKEQIKNAKMKAEKNLKPYVLIVEPGFFHSAAVEKINSSQVGINREIAIKCIVNSIDVDDLIVSTTGKTSRELYEVSANHSRGHNNNFYNVGSMGHASSIGLEIALQRGDRKVYILDGDGALIMHMGSLSTIGYYQPKNLTHIIFDNESHESTGGQPTTSKTTNFLEVLQGCNYKNVNAIQSEAELSSILLEQHQELQGIVIKTQIGSRDDLGRPTDTPKATKNRFMDGLTNDS